MYSSFISLPIISPIFIIILSNSNAIILAVPPTLISLIASVIDNKNHLKIINLILSN